MHHPIAPCTTCMLALGAFILNKAVATEKGSRILIAYQRQVWNNLSLQSLRYACMHDLRINNGCTIACMWNLERVLAQIACWKNILQLTTPALKARLSGLGFVAETGRGEIPRQPKRQPFVPGWVQCGACMMGTYAIWHTCMEGKETSYRTPNKLKTAFILFQL